MFSTNGVKIVNKGVTGDKLVFIASYTASTPSEAYTAIEGVLKRFNGQHGDIEIVTLHKRAYQATVQFEIATQAEKFTG